MVEFPRIMWWFICIVFFWWFIEHFFSESIALKDMILGQSGMFHLLHLQSEPVSRTENSGTV